MDIKSSDISTFKKLYKKQFSQELTDGDARLKLILLVRQMELVYKPVTSTQLLALKNGNGNNNEPRQLSC